MLKLIGIVITVVISGVGFIVMQGCNDKSEKGAPEKTEKQMIIQETESTNKKLSNR